MNAKQVILDQIENTKENLDIALHDFARDAKRLSEQLEKVAQNAADRQLGIYDEKKLSYPVGAHLDSGKMTQLVQEASKIRNMEEQLRTLLHLASKITG